MSIEGIIRPVKKAISKEESKKMASLVPEFLVMSVRKRSMKKETPLTSSGDAIIKRQIRASMARSSIFVPPIKKTAVRIPVKLAKAEMM